MTYVMAFENDQETQDFCERWGFRIRSGFLFFEKQRPPQLPELAWKERRSQKIIESKRIGISLSELFNGGPLPLDSALPWPVHSSFDAQGRLIPDNLTPSSLTLSKCVSSSSQPNPPTSLFSSSANIPQSSIFGQILNLVPATSGQESITSSAHSVASGSVNYSFPLPSNTSLGSSGWSNWLFGHSQNLQAASSELSINHAGSTLTPNELSILAEDLIIAPVVSQMTQAILERIFIQDICARAIIDDLIEEMIEKNILQTPD
ncbi:unnamed protein product [Protopolystoma xenopodis]|uniref:Uncharacterized protein n=1 Tax=Protopolystoma xenopodis TaxID=117903 RepID=A0A3S5BTF0_9PLAT|nr:unnamed protein product [Protopolystoma xenopodis]